MGLEAVEIDMLVTLYGGNRTTFGLATRLVGRALVVRVSHSVSPGPCDLELTLPESESPVELQGTVLGCTSSTMGPCVVVALESTDLGPLVEASLAA